MKKTQVILCRIPQDMADQLQDLSHNLGMTRSTVIRLLLRLGLLYLKEFDHVPQK